MSELSIILGLNPYVPPKRVQSHKGKTNDQRKDEAFENLTKCLKGRVMSTHDLAYFMKINRDSCASYMAKLRDERGLVEVVGETIHAGDSSKQFVWRLV